MKKISKRGLEGSKSLTTIRTTLAARMCRSITSRKTLKRMKRIWKESSLQVCSPKAYLGAIQCLEDLKYLLTLARRTNKAMMSLPILNSSREESPTAGTIVERHSPYLN
jgi:hypothetical protein